MNSEPPQRPWFRNPFVLYFVIGIALLTAGRLLWPEKSPVPEVLIDLPAWELVDQDGDRFGSADLAGQVYIASFFFTRCKTICPALTRSMRSLQDRLAEPGDGPRHRTMGAISWTAGLLKHKRLATLKASACATQSGWIRWPLITTARTRCALNQDFLCGTNAALSLMK